MGIRTTTKKLLLTASLLGVFAASSSMAATITGWNTSNVRVGATPPDGITGSSEVYDRVVPPTGPLPAGATSNGRILFTPPEAVSPGIKVVNAPYTDSGPNPVQLDGCIMTSSAASCDSGFQSGKRIKQMMTGFNPVDLVFNVDSSSTETSIYQVFGRLINGTSKSLAGFSLQLGYGVGNDFVEATAANGLSFSTDFSAQPTGSGSSSTQFPFGLFGDASSNPNFLLDGFFSTQRSGFNTDQTETTLSSTDYFGQYQAMFGPWSNQTDVPTGLFWDFDGDPSTDALLMAWEREPGLWELRRDTGETCDPLNPLVCTAGVTRASFATGSLSEIIALLGADPNLLSTGGIEDLANINLNYAIALGDMGGRTSFTLRTIVTPSTIPLPMSAPLMASGIGLLGFLRRRKKR